MRTRRFFMVSGLFLAMGLFSLSGLMVLIGAPKANAQSVNNFTVQNFNADYYLSKDSDQRSQLKTVEKIIAEFPQTDQNHGIERAIPESYDGHTVTLQINSVTDQNNRPLQYATSQQNGNTVLRIGDANTYVHGQQTYIITYSQHDVTKNFTDHDEFYWDTNGTGWDEYFGALTARVHLPQNLAQSYNDKNACYLGLSGSTETNCVITKEAEGSGVVLTFQANRSLNPGENLTYVLSFKNGTFNVYKLSRHEQIMHWLEMSWLSFGGIVAVVTIVLAVRLWRRDGRAPAGKGTIIPEYSPLKELSVMQSAAILHKNPQAVTAQIIDLAVRKYVKIYDSEHRGLIGKKHSYELELVQLPDGLKPEEVQILEAIFGTPLQVGTRIVMSDLSRQLYKVTQMLQAEIMRGLISDGYYADHVALRRKCIWAAVILLAVGLLTFNPGIDIAGVVLFILGTRLKPLTEKGTTARDYLKGLDMYMQMADADRIRYLQSPDTAEKIQIDPSNPAQLVKLYEKLLPYAILFGIEQQWVKQFAVLYDRPPEWYGGDWATFNAIVLVNSIHGFTSVAATTFSAPSNSSSSGFGGGGFSGGGGGGGGGGGW